MHDNIISFVARGTNSGKTYLMERLIRELKARGRSLTAMKHGTHLMEVDKKGKDTYKFAASGADRIVLFSDNAFMLYELKEPDIGHITDMAARDMDIVLLEGYKSGSFRKIEVYNPDLYTGPLCIDEPSGNYIAIVSKTPVDAGLPWFTFEDTGRICDFIEKQCGLR